MLIDGVSLGAAPDMLFQLFSYITGGERRQKAKALATGEDPDGDAATLDVLAAIEKFPGVRPDPGSLHRSARSAAAAALFDRVVAQGRSQPHGADRRHRALPIGKRDAARRRLDLLAERIAARRPLKVYVQKAHAFGLPADPSVPIIMIGPGTGIAPFRAFLHERMATKAPGRNWLFFGHQRRDSTSSTRTSSPA